MGRICKNKITDHIRDQFGANPLKVPEARIKPMCMLEIKDNGQQYLGEFKFLVKGGFNHEIPQVLEPVANVSDQRSAMADFNTGFGILGNFLKALGVDPAAISASIKNTKKMAFSFSNVRRCYIDPLMLGSVLSENELFADKDNFILYPAMHDKKVRLGLITDIIISNNFSLSTYSESDTAVKIDVPSIADAVANVNVSLKVHKTADNEVKFEGPSDLTFAFSCLELKIDPNSGKFSRGDWLKNIKSIRNEDRTLESMKKEEMKMLDRMLIDHNTEYPLLIDL